jgi:hypothetical protein
MPSWIVGKERSNTALNLVQQCSKRVYNDICIKPQIHAHTKQSEQVHRHGGETKPSSPLHVQTLFQNALNWPKLSNKHVSTVTDSNSSVPKESFPQLMEIFICFASQSSPQPFSIFNRSHCSWTWKPHSKSCVLSIPCSWEDTFTF